MRAAYVCADPGVPAFGAKGCTVHLQEVIRALRAAGVDVELFAARLGGEPPAGLADLVVHELPAVAPAPLAERERALLAANRHLARLLAEAQPFDFIYERHALWSHAGMEFARSAGVPGLLEVNAPLVSEQAEHRGLVARAQANRVTRRTFAAAQAILPVSDELARTLARSAAVRRKLCVVPNAVNPERFGPHVRPTRRRRPGEFAVAFVGTLKPWHGLETLAAAFVKLLARFPEARLVVIGDGPLRATIEQQLVAQGAGDAVHWLGAVSPERVPGLLASVDVAAAPYPPLADFYFSPLKLYEYMAAERPIVASDIGQVARVIEHEGTGLLCRPGDAPALADALVRLRCDRELARRLGRAARQVVLARHTWRQVAERILALVEQLAAPAAEVTPS